MILYSFLLYQLIFCILDKCQKFLLGQVCLKNDIPHRYVEGGMGSVSFAISKAAKEAGAHVVTRAEVYSIVTHFSSFFNATSSL